LELLATSRGFPLECAASDSRGGHTPACCKLQADASKPPMQDSRNYSRKESYIGLTCNL